MLDRDIYSEQAIPRNRSLVIEAIRSHLRMSNRRLCRAISQRRTARVFGLGQEGAEFSSWQGGETNGDSGLVSVEAFDIADRLDNRTKRQ